MAVTPRACARAAPATIVADLGRWAKKMTFPLLVTGLVLIFATMIYLLVAPMFGREVAAKREEFVELPPGDIPRKKIRDSLEAIGCRITRDQKKDIQGRISVGVLSWGEDVSVEFVDGGMKVTSRCIWPMQAIDWGKNRTNVRRFIAEWQKEKEPNQPPPTRPFGPSGSS